MSVKMLHRRRSKLLANPDFSPLAALGFMLICFFLTFEMLQKPVVLPVLQPKEDFRGCYSEIKPGRILTLICEREKIYLYHGFGWDKKIDSISYENLGDLISKKITEVDANPRFEKVMFEYTNPKNGKVESCFATCTYILIKPSARAIFENVVVALNEMKKQRIRCFQLLEIADWEEKLVAKSRK